MFNIETKFDAHYIHLCLTITNIYMPIFLSTCLSVTLYIARYTLAAKCRICYYIDQSLDLKLTA